MSIDVKHCPLCGGSQSSLFDKRSFRGQHVANRLCETCGLVFQSPRMSEAELNTFYETEYRQLYQGSSGPDAKDLAVQRARARSLLGFTRSSVQEVQRHLDIGCSAGLLLDVFREAYGCEAVGIEPGSAYRFYAQQQGLSVFASLEELEAAQTEPFDLVSMAHVLEHIPEPVRYLESLRQKLLAPGGALLLEVPNLYAHDSFEVAHLVAYSPHTLRQAVQKAGFEIVSFQAHGQPRSAVLPLYLTLLARPVSPAEKREFRVLPETGVHRKRQLGLLRRRLITLLSPRRAWLPLPTS